MEVRSWLRNHVPDALCRRMRFQRYLLYLDELQIKLKQTLDFLHQCDLLGQDWVEGYSPGVVHSHLTGLRKSKIKVSPHPQVLPFLRAHMTYVPSRKHLNLESWEYANTSQMTLSLWRSMKQCRLFF